MGITYGIIAHRQKNMNLTQNEAARIATGATKLVSINNMYKEICWESLQKRRNDHKLTLFFKMYNHLAPEYLSSLIPQQVNDISRYNLRNSNNIQTIRAKTNQYNNSFLPSVLRDWNTLPAETKQLNTLSSFKYFLKKDNKPVPKYYYYGKKKNSNTTYPATNRLQFSESRLVLEKYHWLTSLQLWFYWKCATLLFPLQILSASTQLTS